MLTAILNHHNINSIFELIDQNHHKVDVFELRLDCLINEQLTNSEHITAINNKIKAHDKKTIFTLRSQNNYGLFQGSESSRLAIILKLAELNPDYIDLEYDVGPEFFQTIAVRFPEIKIICSYHDDSKKNSLDITYVNSIWATILKNTKNYKIDNYKLIFHAHNIIDNLVILKFLSDINRLTEYNNRITAHCMGELGLPSRILGKKVGNRFTYGLINDFNAAQVNNIGGIKVDDLLNIYNYKTLNQHTKIFCLIGKPVTSSIGHVFHNNYYRENNIDAIYIKILINSISELDLFFSWFKEIPISGCSVTMPYKTSLSEYLENKSIVFSRPINTVKNINGKLYGINTDGEAVVELLLEYDHEFNKLLISYQKIQDKKILILGAGGAAQSIVAEFSKYKPKGITIVNRTYDKAKKISQQYNCNILSWDDLSSLSGKSEKYDYIINTISFNLDNNEKNNLLTKINKILMLCTNSKTLYLDINYNHHENIKGDYINVPGYEMYVKQALKQIDYWLS